VTDDLVKRLREDAKKQMTWDYSSKRASDLEIEAADRIEELQDEVTYLRAFARKTRAALGEKKDD